MNRFMVTVVFAGTVFVSSTALGVAQRTFVASTGNDAAPCSLAAPCRSFDAALAQTATDGEIIVLDSAGYGAVAITNDVSIIAPKGVYAGISVFPTSPNAAGITVYNSKVTLRGLSINGQGGDLGVYVFGNAVVHIEDCAISNVDQYGVRVSGLSGSPEVFIEGSVIRDNGNHGVYANGSARVHVDKTSIRRNGGDGVLAANGPTVTATASVLSANSGNGAALYSDNGVSVTRLTVSDSTMARNVGRGVYGVSQVSGSSVYVYVARSTVASNTLDGVSALATSGGGLLAHVNDNVVTANSSGIAVDGGAGSNGSLIASNNNVTGNVAVGFAQLNGGFFYTRGNNTAVTYSGSLSPLSGL
jgi:hypothetical protein